MMATDRSLRRLARLAGVTVAYRDIWKTLRRVPSDTLRAILGAMGFSMASESDLVAGIAELERGRWGGLLPPVAVVVAGDTVAVPVITESGGRACWRLTLESGESREGSAELGALTVLAERRERRQLRRHLALALGPAVPPGYHRLAVSVGGASAETVVIAAPRRCHLPSGLEEGDRRWALTAQLYSLRSARNWGIGDFTDLATLGAGAARRGASALGINPLHALFPAEPRHISPYSPSSRLFLNPLYIDVEAVPDFHDGIVLPDAVRAARAGDLVDYEAVARLKRDAFDALYRDFAAQHLGAAESARGAAFRRFQREGGRPLDSFATFTALHEHVLAERGAFSWQDWPASLRQSGSAEVARFAAEHRGRVELHQYLQWEADRQLAAAAGAAASAGLSLGLYRDLAVGVDHNGAEAWADPAMMVSGAAVGAPPDFHNLKGQDWGLAPVNPVTLQREAFAPFIAALRANMRHAGLLRLDHVMALKQLYWVPRGASPAEGSYVAYPFAELRHILALESERQRCAVIGEDLGTVPEGFRETMQQAGVLSYRLMLFERDSAGRFLPPDVYPEPASAAFSTHDLATLRGFWRGRDLEWRRDLDLYPDAAAAAKDARERRRDRRRLLDALIAAGALPRAAARHLLPRDDRPVDDPALAEAVHRFLGRSKARLVLMQIEDVVGEIEQANLPGTIREHPNWRRKLSRLLEEILDDPAFERLAAAVAEGQRAR
ncbi:MAG: 4-alpha-glucanotransferase [Stellaceae bacterium]